METPEQHITPEIMPDPPRPQMLSVLCILTWVLSGLFGLRLLADMVITPSQESINQQLAKMEEAGVGMTETIQAVFESIQTTEYKVALILIFLTLILSSFGAVLMWRLKKSGFYIYVAGEILQYIGFYMILNIFSPVFAPAGITLGQMAGSMIVFFGLFDAVFIGLYASRLKYMKN